MSTSRRNLSSAEKAAIVRCPQIEKTHVFALAEELKIQRAKIYGSVKISQDHMEAAFEPPALEIPDNHPYFRRV